MKRLIALALIACLFAVTGIGCGETKKTGTTGTTRPDTGSSTKK